MRVTVKPFGPVDAAALERIRSVLGKFGDVEMAPPGEVPAGAYDARRKKYRAPELLDACKEEPGHRVLAVTDVDLYVEGKTFVFGYAFIRGRYAVISTARLRDGGAPRFLERVEKETVHELGHTLGLDHDANPACVMHFSRSLADTDRKGSRFCGTCEALAGATLTRLGT